MVLAIWAVLTKIQTRKKKLLIAAICLLFLCSNKVFVNELFLLWEPSTLQSTPSKTNVAVVLGGFAESDPQRGRIELTDAAERLFEAVKLYQQKKIDTIFVSGGAVNFTGYKTPESVLVKQYLTDLGIDPGKILTDTASKNTYENAQQTVKILGQRNPQSAVLLITSAAHMKRAEGCFKKAGMHYIPHPVHFISSKGRGYVFADFVLPSSQALFQFDALVKEWVGYLVYRISGKA